MYVNTGLLIHTAGTVPVNFFEQDILNIQYFFEATIKVNIYDGLYIDFSEIDVLLN